MSLSKYTSIDRLYKVTDELFSRPCVVTEKIHGTNVSFGVKEGVRLIGSRNRTVYRRDGVDEIRYGDHYGSVAYLTALPKKPRIVREEFWQVLEKHYPEYTFYGEWYGNGVQKGVKYFPSTLEKDRDLAIFDIRGPNGTFLNWNEVLDACNDVEVRTKQLTVEWPGQEAFKLYTVPELYRGPITLDKLDSFLNQNSTQAMLNGVKEPVNIAEGIVVKPLQEALDGRGNRVIFKYKSEIFQEIAKQPKLRKLTPEEIAEKKKIGEFAENIVTSGRVSTIVEHITRDNPEIDIKRMPDFLKELSKDISEEFREFFDSMDKKERKIYNREISAQGARLFKEYLYSQI